MDSTAQSTPIGSKNSDAGLAEGFRRDRKSFLLLTLFLIYRSLLRPFLHGLALTLMGPLTQCRYTPSCGDYAEEAFSRHGVCKGLALTVARLCKCHPWAKANPIDPVPHSFGCRSFSFGAPKVKLS